MAKNIPFLRYDAIETMRVLAQENIQKPTDDQLSAVLNAYRGTVQLTSFLITDAVWQTGEIHLRMDVRIDTRAAHQLSRELLDTPMVQAWPEHLIYKPPQLPDPFDDDLL